MRTARYAKFCAPVVLVAVAGCGQYPSHKIGDGVKAALPQVIGPADTWAVDVSGNQGTILGGRVPEVAINGVNVQVSPQLNMSGLNIDAKNIRVDIAKKSLKSIDSLTFSGALTQANLDRYLRLTSGDDPDRPKKLAISLRRDDLLISFKYEALGISVPVKVAGRMYVSPTTDDKIDLHPTSAAVAKISMPRKLLEFQMRGVNPIMDLGTMKFPVHLSNIHVADRMLVFSGKAEVPASAIAAAQEQISNAK